MKRLYVCIVWAIVILSSQTLLWADANHVQITKTNGAKPEWLSIEVRQKPDGLVAVTLRMAERKDFIGYNVTLLVESGLHKGLCIPVAVTKVSDGFVAYMKLSTQVASAAKLTIYDTYAFGDGGTACTLDIPSYLTEKK